MIGDTITETNYLNIFVKLRNWVLLFQFTFFLFAFISNMITSLQVLLGMGVISTFFLANLSFFILHDYKMPLLIHISLDFFLVNFLLFISGGYQNPLIVIVFIHFLIVPAFLSFRGVMAFGIFGSSCLFLLRSTTFTLHYGELNFLNVFEGSIIFVSLLSLALAYWIKTRLVKLQDTNEKLKAYTSRLDRYRSLGLLASGVCHELGTPLNTILMRVQRLLKINQGEDLIIVERNTVKCIEALRKLNLQVHNETESFYDEVINISIMLKKDVSQMDMQNLKVVFDIGIKDCFVRIPRILLLNSINEILINAKEAHASEVKIKLTRKKRTVFVQFCDNGNGFSHDILNTFGIPFNSTKRLGTGLALYHLSNLMIIAGGSLGISNSVEGGGIISLQLIEVFE
jgi:two-component system sensor histidine kinase RegB